MITLTNKALKKIKDLLNNNSKSKYLRIGVAGSGCLGYQYKMIIEENDPKEKDIILTFDGVMVILDNKSARILDGTQIDYKSSLMQYGFDFNNPNVKKLCGCGKSFSLNIVEDK